MVPVLPELKIACEVKNLNKMWWAKRIDGGEEIKVFELRNADRLCCDEDVKELVMASLVVT